MNGPWITQVLPELVREGLITADQAERIRARYAADPQRSGNRMLLVFAILGSLLVGLGIILIIAHNWDDLGRGTRTAIAFVPVVLGQGLVLYGIIRSPEVAAWRRPCGIARQCPLRMCFAHRTDPSHRRIAGGLPPHMCRADPSTALRSGIILCSTRLPGHDHLVRVDRTLRGLQHG